MLHQSLHQSQRMKILQRRIQMRGIGHLTTQPVLKKPAIGVEGGIQLLKNQFRQGITPKKITNDNKKFSCSLAPATYAAPLVGWVQKYARFFIKPIAAAIVTPSANLALPVAFSNGGRCKWV